jgi:hypothetical protein
MGCVSGAGTLVAGLGSHLELTKRGTPSGSPILMTVCSCFEREEPVE